MYCNFTTVSVSCNNLWMNAVSNEICGTDLGGNMSVDPLFCASSAMFEVMPESPCLPNNNSCGTLIGAHGTGCTATDVTDSLDESPWLKVSNARQKVSFSFLLPRDDFARLDVYDVRGRHIVEVFSKYTQAGVHNASWLGRGSRTSSGVYFARLTTGSSGSVKTKFLRLF